MNARAPDKQLYLRAFDHVEQATVPFVELEVDFTVVEKVLGRKVEPGVRSYCLPAEDYVEFLQRVGMDMAYGCARWTLGRKEVPDAAGRMLYVDGTIKTRADLKTIEPRPDDEVRRYLDALMAAVDGTGLGVLYNHVGAPFIVATAVGYQDYYTMLLTDPDFIREAFRIVNDVLVRQLDIVHEYAIDAQMISAVMAMNTGPIMSDEIIEEFELPYLQYYIDRARARGLPRAGHFDGDNTAYFPRLIEMGMQAFQAIETCGQQNIFRLKELYGDRVVLHGNVDCGLLTRGTPGDVAEDVRRQIAQLSVGGGYVCGSSHDISERVPFENFVTMVETIHSTPGHVGGAAT